MNEHEPAAPGLRTDQGVYVLGMHRSGTSVVAGIVERLGLDGGPRRSMLSADEFNSDGYWEQRPIVEFHDRMLNLLGGWASAPPAEVDLDRARTLAAQARPRLEAVLGELYRAPWFVKDPRHCLLLDLWTELRGTSQLAVVVSRDPEHVARSLDRRNTYSPELAAALWESYTRQLLRSLGGRPAVVVHYEELTSDPATVVTRIAEGLDRLADLAEPASERIPEALSLVRAAREQAGTRETQPLTTEQQQLAAVVRGLSGIYEAFPSDLDLPAYSPSAAAVLARRRQRLNLIKPLIRSSSSLRARLDQFPAKLREWRSASA